MNDELLFAFSINSKWRSINYPIIDCIAFTPNRTGSYGLPSPNISTSDITSSQYNRDTDLENQSYMVSENNIGAPKKQIKVIALNLLCLILVSDPCFVSLLLSSYLLLFQ